MRNHKWSFTLSAVGFITAALSILISATAGLGIRFEWFNFRIGLEILSLSVIVALAAAAVSVIALIVFLFTPRKGWVWLCLVSLILSVPVAGYPLYMRYAVNVPPIHDITTDTVNPPAFVSVLPLRKDAVNSVRYGGPETAALQMKAYPDIKTLPLHMPADKAFSKAVEAARSLGWKIVEASPQDGRIEATAATFWMGFKDDIVIRITARGGLCDIDIRSVSRVGKSDLGANAKRIRRFLAEMRK